MAGAINTTTQEYLNIKAGTVGLSKQQALNRLAEVPGGGSTGVSAQEAANRYGASASAGFSVQGGLCRKVSITNPSGLETQIAASRL